ncbi:MAG: PadR family transcriptional regulator [Acidimicrobiia bacterium]|nr:PadR family transcriptional regulator [Acidimicrobiia bacterium]
MPDKERELTGTAYAVLGLLSLRPWSAYELTQQMERSIDTFWTRASSQLYAEVKRLSAVGMAEATKETVGRRPRTTYTITPAGRGALEAWLQSPGRGLSLDFEALVKVFFAEQGSLDGLRANLYAALEWAQDRQQANREASQSILDHGGPFPDRLAVIALVFAFKVEIGDVVARWANWALDVTADWPADPTQWTAPTEPFHRAIDQPDPPTQGP